MSKFGDTFGDALFGYHVDEGSAEDLERRIYAGPAPWLAEGEDFAPASRGMKIRAFAFDESAWEDIEELTNVLDSTNVNSKEQDHFAQQDDGSLALDDPTGAYAFGGAKHHLLQPRKLIRLEQLVWSAAGQIVDKVGVYRIVSEPVVTVSAETGVPSYTYTLEDWARERIEKQMPTDYTPFSFMVWRAQGITSPSRKYLADLNGQQPPEKLYEQAYITDAGDALFYGAPYISYNDVIYPSAERTTEESDWRYTLIGYIFANLFYQLDGRFTVDESFRDMRYQMRVGKPQEAESEAEAPPPIPLAMPGASGTQRAQGMERRRQAPAPLSGPPSAKAGHSRGSLGAQARPAGRSGQARARAAFGPREGSAGSVSPLIDDDPVTLFGGSFFYGNADEWPTWRQFLQSIFAEDPQTNSNYGFITWGSYPAKLYYDGDGTLHLAKTADKHYKGRGFSCPDWKGQNWQLPLESIDRNPEAPDFNRVVIERDEVLWVEPAVFDTTAPFNPPVAVPDEEPGPMELVSGGGSASPSIPTEWVRYVDLKARNKWYTWDTERDKPLKINPSIPLVFGPLLNLGTNFQSRADMLRYRAGAKTIYTQQAKAILACYLSRAYTITISLSNRIPFMMFEVLLIHSEHYNVTGYFRITSRQRRFDAQPQILTCEWIEDS